MYLESFWKVRQHVYVWVCTYVCTYTYMYCVSMYSRMYEHEIHLCAYSELHNTCTTISRQNPFMSAH
jgi:hypothetical protein